MSLAVEDMRTEPFESIHELFDQRSTLPRGPAWAIIYLRCLQEGWRGPGAGGIIAAVFWRTRWRRKKPPWLHLAVNSGGGYYSCRSLPCHVTLSPHAWQFDLTWAIKNENTQRKDVIRGSGWRQAFCIAKGAAHEALYERWPAWKTRGTMKRFWELMIEAQVRL